MLYVIATHYLPLVKRCKEAINQTIITSATIKNVIATMESECLLIACKELEAAIHIAHLLLPCFESSEDVQDDIHLLASPLILTYTGESTPSTHVLSSCHLHSYIQASPSLRDLGYMEEIAASVEDICTYWQESRRAELGELHILTSFDRTAVQSACYFNPRNADNASFFRANDINDPLSLVIHHDLQPKFQQVIPYSSFMSPPKQRSGRFSKNEPQELLRLALHHSL